MIELKILEDSLVKKKSVLIKIGEESKNQEAALKAESVSIDDFEIIVDKKAELIDELNKLDQGFESVYDRVKEQLLADQKQFREQIGALKNLISEITELSVSIQAQEARNKSLVEKFFEQSRQDIQTDRVRAKSAYNYMNRMTSQEEPARFMDTRK